MSTLDLDPTIARRERNNLLDDQYSGTKPGAVFFGWLVAVALSVLLTGVVGAVATGVGTTMSLTRDQAEANAQTIGIASAVVILLILMTGYLAGGYVAGRLARFSGRRQGLGVWVLGLAVAIVVAVAGAVFGAQYDIIQRANLPTMPITTGSATLGGLVVLVVALLGTAGTAVLGGVLGQRYHDKIDRGTLES